jgi:hypothetical protein
MHWWRSKRRSGVGLGLFALAVQLLLSFGHIHAQDVLPPSAFAAVPATPLLPGAKIANISSVPTEHRAPNGLPDDDCPICMAMHMTASGLLPVPPFAVVPIDFDRVAKNTPFEELDLSVRRYALFRTRAPPFA